MKQLTEQDETLAFALASGKTQEEAGRAVGISRVTVWRRLLDPEFRGRVALLRRLIADEVLSRLVSRAADAIEVLHLAATTDAEETADRIRAADLLLSHLLKFGERADVDERISKLEAAHERGGAAREAGAGNGDGDPQADG